jgi:hypothetical protein
MARIALLNNVDHHDLRLARRRGAANGETINQVRVFPSEFRALQREYPLFFRRDAAGDFQTVALLGLDADENLYLDDDIGGEMAWNARVIPAILDRGPFSIGTERASDAASGHMIMIDLDHPWLDRERGEPLFFNHGGNAPAVTRAADTLRILHEGVALERDMFTAFAELGLLAGLDINLRVDETREYLIPDLFTVHAEALRALGGDALQNLHASGLLELATCISLSHANLERLVAEKRRRLGFI